MKPDATQQPDARRPRILSADDDPAVGQILNLIYSGAYELHQATSMDEARTLLAAQDFDLLILDVNFPDGDGIQLLREMQGGGLRRPGAVLMLTGSTDRPDLEQSWELGALSYLNKPVDLPRLSEAIELALANRSAPAPQDPGPGPPGPG